MLGSVIFLVALQLVLSLVVLAAAGDGAVEALAWSCVVSQRLKIIVGLV